MSNRADDLINLFDHDTTLNIIFDIEDILLDTESTTGNIRHQLKFIRELRILFEGVRRGN